MNTEKDFLPLKLIDIFNSLEYEEEGNLQIESIYFIEEDILFNFSLYPGIKDSKEIQYWEVRIKNYKDFNINFNETHNYFEFYSNHIALQQYKLPPYELYFKNMGFNPELLYIDIVRLHRDVFNNFISTKYIQTDLMTLCNSNYGLFARGAKPILEYYFESLKRAGKKPYFYKPNIRCEQDDLNINYSYKLISLGSIYFIGTDFIFKEKSM